MSRLLKDVVLAPVRLYRRYLSPLKPVPSCRFHPTCSEYALEAVETHGVLKGMAMATWRVLRCNPFNPGGFDPVPPRRGHGHTRGGNGPAPKWRAGHEHAHSEAR
ncbi:MAG TPA: membrane protein insertion efficiency factor YidD [Trueperaceae bacterium]